jgi:hypothetical protein
MGRWVATGKKEVDAMMRTLLTGSFVVALASSCASAPSKPQATQSPPPAAPVSTPTPAPEETQAATAVLPIDPHGELGRGKCIDCFDCVDTVGFPAPGYRWACVNGKCEKAKLTGFTGVSQPAEVVSNSEPAKRPSKARKSSRRHD